MVGVKEADIDPYCGHLIWYIARLLVRGPALWPSPRVPDFDGCRLIPIIFGKTRVPDIQSGGPVAVIPPTEGIATR